MTTRFRDTFVAKASREGVSSELTTQFIEQFVTTETPTVATLRDAYPEVAADMPPPRS